MNLSYNTHCTQDIFLQNDIKKHIFEELLFEVDLFLEELVQN